MKKTIAYILTCIMIITMVPHTTLRAATKIISVSDKYIIDDQNLSQARRINGKFPEELGAVAIDISKDGKYKLKYYIDAGNNTQKVEIEFRVGPQEIDADLKVINSDGTPVSQFFILKDSVNSVWPNTEVTGTELKLNRKREASYADKGKVLKLQGQNLEIRYAIDRDNDNSIIVTTNGVKIGNITPFYVAYNGSTLPDETAIIQSLAEFKSEPIHFKNDGTLDTISDITAPDKAGSSPGMKIQFKHPQEIEENEDGSFGFKDIIDGDKIQARLTLEDFSIAENSTIQIQVDFNTITSSVIVISDKDEVGEKLYDPVKKLHTIYIAKEEPRDQGTTVIKWQGLKPSAIMNETKLYIANATNTNLKGLTFKVLGNAYTYLNFWVERITKDQAVIRLKPYSGLGSAEVTYTVLKDGETVGTFTTITNDTIPIPFTKNGIQNYQIITKVFGQQISSQILTYNASTDTNIPLKAPNSVEINNIYAVPSLEERSDENLNPQPQAIGFDLSWQVSENIEELLKEGKLYYEMLLYDSAQTLESARVYSHVFKLGDNNQMSIYAGAPNGKTGIYTKKDSGYMMSIKGVALKTDPDNPKWNQLSMPFASISKDEYLNAVSYPNVGINTGEIKLQSDLDYSKSKNYYVTIRAVYEKDIETQLIPSAESVPISVSIDETRELVPVVDVIEKLNANQDTNTSSVITFSKVDLLKYYARMLEPANWRLSRDNVPGEEYFRTYEVFLYQDNKEKKTYEDGNFKFENVIKGDLNANNELVLEEEQKSKMRSGEILATTYTDVGNTGKLPIKFSNLDPNQAYYLRIKVKIKAFRNKGLAQEPITYEDYSILSKIYSFTTSTNPTPPNIDEQVPPAPQEFQVKIPEDDNTTAIATWKRPIFTPADEDWNKVEYEILRTTDIKLTDDLLSETNIKASEIIETIKERVGAGKFQDPYVQLFKTKDLKLQDSTLSPNMIYYYYLRTVYTPTTDNGQVMSEWIMMSVTTNPIKEPTQLKLEEATKRTLEISFLAAVPKDAKVYPDQNAEYDFDIEIQTEDDPQWKKVTNKTELSRSTDKEPNGHTRFKYIINDLKPGKGYNIRVRALVDMNKSGFTDENYVSSSAYSKTIYVRTEFDQEDQDKDNKFGEYLKKYDDAVEKLRRNTYWEAESDSRNARAYKYRESYINAELAVRNLYELQTEKDINKLTYYFPASMLNKANDLNVVITAVLGNESMNLRPYTITSDNEAIKEAVSRLNQKKIKDYYIKLDFYTMTTSARSINGETLLSPEICIDIEIVYISEEDMIIEDDIMIELNDLIKREREDIIKQLEKELSKGTINEEKLKDIIDVAVGRIRKDHQKRVKAILRRERQTSSAVNEIEKPILIGSILDSFSVNGYYLEGTWISVEVLQASGGFAIEAHKLGIYAFTGQTNLINKVPEIAMYQNIISKYNLTDFFVVDSYMIKTGATKKQVYGALARILGAKRNTDYLEYLKTAGIKGITSIGVDKTIRQDEAIYLVMQAYEKIYKRPINSINIKNKQGITNIGAFQVQYRPYIYAAVELKIIKNPNAQVLPSKALSVEETISMFSKIVSK